MAQSENERSPLYKVLLGFFLAVLLLTSIKDSYFIHLRLDGSGWQKFSFLFEHLMYNAIVVALYMFFILKTTRYFFQRNIAIVYLLFFHFFFSIISGVVAYFLVFVLSLVTGNLTLQNLYTFNHIERLFATLDLNFLIYFSIFFIILIHEFYHRNRRTEIEKERLTNRLTASNLNLIKSQLEPHFLFNSLNAISSLVHTDQDKAVSTISEFGKVLREILAMREVHTYAIADEIDFLRSYVSVFESRFEDGILFTSDIPKSLEKEELPALILQPLVENAIKYGLQAHHQVHVHVQANKEGSELTIKVKNSGSYFSSSHKGKGIQITEERLALSHPNTHTFTYENTHDLPFSVCATITILR